MKRSLELGELLTTQEVCAIIKRGPHQLRRYELQGLIRAFRPAGGKRKVYRREDVAALVFGHPSIN